jgi:RNA recognition motif-containing protein
MDVFVGNLPPDIGPSDLRALFEKFGEVAEIRLIKDPPSGRFKRYAFVEMPSEEQAQKAIEEMNGTDLKEMTLTVSEAKPKRPRIRRGRHGGKKRGGRGKGAKGRKTVYGGEDRGGIGNRPPPSWNRK